MSSHDPAPRPDSETGTRLPIDGRIPADGDPAAAAGSVGEGTLPAEATAAPDPRDRRKRDRRRTAPPAGVGEPDERRRTDRRRSAVPDLYRDGERHMNEYPLDPDEMEFINTVNAYRQQHGRPFPTWSEVLHIVKFLGYRRPAGAPHPAED